MLPTFSDAELTYLRGQRLGRLATVDSAGAPQNNPVGYFIDSRTGQLIVAGTFMGKTRKYRNVQRNAHVSLVIDDVVATDPWQVRGVEVRGIAEAEADVDPPMAGLSREIIRITPRWIGSWGITPGREGLDSRGLPAERHSRAEGGSGKRAVEDGVRRLVEAYFRGFDRKRTDEAWLATIFSDDISVRFPAGVHDGLAGLAQLQSRILSLWDSTLHQTSNYHVNRRDDRADFDAVLTATHIHRPDDPGSHLHIGAQITGEAARLPVGWRIAKFAIDLVWTEGDGPAGRSGR